MADSSSSGLLDMVPVAGPVLSAISGLFGSIQSNKTNKAIARETNALNKQMFDEQMQYNWDMWNATNAYNSPSAMRQRLKDAGYNPASLIDSPNLGSAAIGGSAPSAPQMQGYQFNSPIGALGKSLELLPSVALAAAQTEKTKEEAKGQAINNASLDARLNADLNKLVAERLLTDAQAEKYRQDVAFKDANWDSLTKEISENLYYLHEQGQREKIANELQREWGNKIRGQEFAKLVAEVATELERKNTERANQVLAKAYGDAATANAVTARIVGESTAAKNYSDKEWQDLQNQTYKVFGRGIAAQDFLNSLKEGRIKDAEAKLADFMKQVQSTKGWKTTKMAGELISNMIPLLKQIKF